MTTILILQLIAHVLADFFFQQENWVKEKEEKIISKSHLIHILIIFLFSYLLSFQVGFIFYSLIISFLHLLTDAGKSYIKKHFKNDVFFIDQIVHIGIIVIIITLLLPTDLHNIPFEVDPKYIAIVLSYILCLKPANFAIQKIFELYKIKIPSVGLPNAGKLIGNTERILTLTFMLTGNYEVVGFIIASKSILRFKETDTLNSEYVLTGTLLSFGIAIMIGIALRWLYFS